MSELRGFWKKKRLGKKSIKFNLLMIQMKGWMSRRGAELSV
jgi:hypothetical protein